MVRPQGRRARAQRPTIVHACVWNGFSQREHLAKADQYVAEAKAHGSGNLKTLERRQDDLLRQVSELADAIAAMELKLRQ
jgi:tryptophan synthase alpha subunit